MGWHQQTFSALLAAWLSTTAAAQGWTDSLLNIIQQLPEDTSKVRVLNELSWELNKTDPAEARKRATQALQLARRLDDDFGKPAALNRIGNTYLVEGHYVEALTHYLAALRLWEELAATSRDRKVQLGQAHALNNVGLVHYYQADYDQAMRYYNRALNIRESIGDSAGIAMSQNNIGILYSINGDHNNALRYHRKALAYRESLGDLPGMGASYTNIGNAYQGLNQYALQFDYFNKALALYEKLGDLPGVANSRIELGKASLYMEDYPAAVSYFSQGLLEAKQLSYRDNVKEAYVGLANAYQALGDFERAFDNLTQFILVKDSLLNEARAKQIAELQTQYETEKKEKEIAVKNLKITQQRRDITLVAGASFMLLLAVVVFALYRNRRTRHRALKEIREAKLASLKSLMDKHFIFGSLHSIDALLMRHDMASASDYLTKYAKLIRMVLDMANQPEGSLEDELSLCKTYLELERLRLDNGFNYEFSIDSALDASHVMFPSMLLQPLVENAVKHGMGSLDPEGLRRGLISVSVERIGDRLVSRVSDNGKGLLPKAPNEQHRSYSARGIAERVRIYNNVRKNKAAFAIRDNHPGVTAELTIPLVTIRKTEAA